MKNEPTLVVSDKKGRIYDLPPFAACGMEGGNFLRLSPRDLIKIPYGSELFTLPERIPVGYDRRNDVFTAMKDFFAVSAFLSPGYTITHNSAYVEAGSPDTLPLFAYGAVAFYKNEFYAAARRVDRELRQDLRFMDMGLLHKNVKRFRKLYPKNRLIRHLESCALTYGCPAAKNFFLERYEGPLPTSPYCNAYCLGCISQQPAGGCSVTQPRIKFIPTPEEIAETALHHIKAVKDPVVSFGQGCEGEPLLEGETIEKAIRMIRSVTSKGIINMNTNASLPKVLSRLFDAGLDSIRVSLNSVREESYERYYKPKGYSYKDVVGSIKVANTKKAFVSLNYLVMPGFSDSFIEFNALRNFLHICKVDMIQWRNLNYDPVRYFKVLKADFQTSELIGMRQLILSVNKEFPHLVSGYFNPSKRRISYYK